MSVGLSQNESRAFGVELAARDRLTKSYRKARLLLLSLYSAFFKLDSLIRTVGDIIWTIACTSQLS
jgi:hypothetical protein